MLVAIEGIDGSGKATIARLTVNLLRSSGYVARSLSFPRYGETLSSHTIQAVLNGSIRPEGLEGIYFLAAAFGIDRYECFARTPLAGSEIVVIDRYVASNKAFQMARAGDENAQLVRSWIDDFEHVRLGLPRADLTVFLDIPEDLALKLIAARGARAYTEASFDEFEGDRELQKSVRRRYQDLAALEAGIWRTVATAPGGVLRQPEEIAAEVLQLVLAGLPG